MTSDKNMKLLRKFQFHFRNEKLEAEMAEEMRLHVELQTARNIGAGMNPDEARFAALRQFGNVASLQEQAREARGWGWLERTFKDLQFACRQLLKTPGFTLVAVVTLAVGIGLNTAMFSLLNRLFLRPLPFENSAALVHLRRSTPQNPAGDFAPADFLDLKRAEADFGLFAGYSGQSVSLSAPGHPAELAEARSVSADYFKVLGIRPETGRAFLPEEETYGRHRVVVLSHALWASRFGGAANVIGQTVRVDSEEYEIVGILPAWANDDRVIRRTALFRPLAFPAAEHVSRTNQAVGIIGRRWPVLTVGQGEEFVAAFGASLAVAFPAENNDCAWHCEDLLGSTGNSTGRSIVAMLLGLSGCVLLIACSNLANFLLARTISRSHELAVRAALGASRVHLIRPLAVEALVLAFAGGGAALLVSVWALHWFSNRSVASGGAPMNFPLDWRVLGFALGTSLFTALFFGVAPALLAIRVNVNDTLKRGARGATASRGHNRLRHLLIIGQFAMALTLVAGAGLMARGASNFLRKHVGWDSSSIAQGSFELPKVKYPGGAQIVAFDRQVLERLRRVPGVQAVSLSYGLPYDGPFGPRPYLADGHDRPVKGQEPAATYNGVTEDYFSVTGLRLLRGRVFNAADSAASPKVVIINESMARALFPDEDPVGRRLAVAGDEKPVWAEIVGVVADVSSFAIYRRPVRFQTYHPFVQEPWQNVRFAARTSEIAPESVLTSLRGAISALDPDLPVRELRTADATIEHYAFEITLLRNILGTFALLGLSLAALGIYGVIARTVVQRSGEIGIRVALGANVSDIVRLVLGFGVRLALIGAALGIFGAYGLSRLVASIMPSLQTNDDLVLGVSLVVLALIALAACYLPARKASKIDPISALRAE